MAPRHHSDLQVLATPAGEVETGIWCERCLLPSVVAAPLLVEAFCCEEHAATWTRLLTYRICLEGCSPAVLR